MLVPSDRWAIFVSGQGSNALRFLMDSDKGEVKVVVSSKASALALKRAKRFGVQTMVLDKNIDWDSLTLGLKQRKVNKIFLLGFMRVVPANFLQDWQGSIYNLHPSLLPNFKGKDAIQRSYLSREPMGVSVHHVSTGIDEGKVILQKQVISLDQKRTMDYRLASTLMAFAEQNVVARSRNLLI